MRRSVINVLEYTYGPVIVSALFCYFLAASDPAQEVILGHLADFQIYQAPEAANQAGLFTQDEHRSGRLQMAVVLLIALPFFTVWSARQALRLCDMDNEPAAPFIIALIPLMFIIAYPAALIGALRSPEAPALDQNTLAWLFAALVFVLLQFLAAVARMGNAQLYTQALDWLDTIISKDTMPALWMVLRGYVIHGLAALFMVIVIWKGFFSPGTTGQIGALGMAAGFAAAAALLLAALTVLSHRVAGNFPLVLVLLGLSGALVSPVVAGAVVVGLILLILLTRASARSRTPLFLLTGIALVYSGSHLVDGACQTWSGCNHVQGVPPAEKPIYSAQRAFQDWPRAASAPVRIAAAQGGGLYAAYHTAYYLAARADTDPEFTRTLFAISGVSGGSVGGGVYWAIRQSGVCDRADAAPDCHRAAVDAILRRDFLTPALAGLLFRDNLDNVVPYSAAFEEPIDRGAVLEAALADALGDWTEAQGLGRPAYFDRALTASWSPDKGAPLLVFNATRVDNGHHYILSPLRQIRGGVPGLLELWGGRDLTVGNAMVISARFPVVTPPARVRVRTPGQPDRPQVIQLADGGYFDNSGLESVTELLHALKDDMNGTRVEVIQFTADETAAPPQVKGTFGAPLSAFTAAWRARRDLTAKRVMQFFPAQDAPPSPDAPIPMNVVMCVARTIPHEVNFTVSWYLAQKTFDAIKLQIEEGHGAIPMDRKNVSFDTILQRTGGVPDCSTKNGLTPPGVQVAAQ